MLRRLLLGACIALCAAPAAHAETFAIANVRILTMSAAGDIEKGVVVVRDGRIAAVGADVAIPSGARVVDASGLTLTPGLVATVTPLGLNDQIGSGYPGRTSSNPRLSAGFDVLADVNPNSPQIPEARIEGVTHAIVTPNAIGLAAGKVFGGQAGLIELRDGLDLTERRGVAVVMDAGEVGAQSAGGGQGAQLVILAQILSDVRAYARNRAGFDLARLEEFSLSRADMEALVPVASGRTPLLVEVNRASDIHNVLAFAREQRIRIVLSGAAEAWMLANEIARANVPVILDADVNAAFSFDQLNAASANAAILREAGVLIAFKPSVARIVFLIRTPRFPAGRATRFGLSRTDALAAITINPARIFGFDASSGSIEPGKDADFVLWSGDPLETTTVARQVFIDGAEMPMTARNRALRDRYIGAVLGGDAQETPAQ